MHGLDHVINGALQRLDVFRFDSSGILPEHRMSHAGNFQKRQMIFLVVQSDELVVYHAGTDKSVFAIGFLHAGSLS